LISLSTNPLTFILYYRAELAAVSSVNSAYRFREIVVVSGDILVSSVTSRGRIIVLLNQYKRFYSKFYYVTLHVPVGTHSLKFEKNVGTLYGVINRRGLPWRGLINAQKVPIRGFW